jgi:hypothetical protein
LAENVKYTALLYQCVNYCRKKFNRRGSGSQFDQTMRKM